MTMTTSVKEMLDAYPADPGGVDREAMAKCIEECIACAQACTACADACLSEGMVEELTKCIRTNMDCADICNTTASVLSRHTGYDANISPRSCRRAPQPARRAPRSAAVTRAPMSTAASARRCRSCEQACTELLAKLGWQGTNRRTGSPRRRAVTACRR
ncbi:four-helix bundle copper-binding protein [Streptomyces bullii]